MTPVLRLLDCLAYQSRIVEAASTRMTAHRYDHDRTGRSRYFAGRTDWHAAREQYDRLIAALAVHDADLAASQPWHGVCRPAATAGFPVVRWAEFEQPLEVAP
ncbi:MAG: hypothetical protein IT337_10795 [Thermomicrobiales bacterium]|nr:hypothetical protein [Thermomicrobiales bacterium]